MHHCAYCAHERQACQRGVRLLIALHGVSVMRKSSNSKGYQGRVYTLLSMGPRPPLRNIESDEQIVEVRRHPNGSGSIQHQRFG